MPKNSHTRLNVAGRNGRDGRAPSGPAEPAEALELDVPRASPLIAPPPDPDGFDPFDPAQATADPELAEIVRGIEPDRPLISFQWPRTNFRLHPGGSLGTLPFVEVPDGVDRTLHLIDARLVKDVVARGAVVKMKRLYRAMTWNPDVDPAEQIVVRSAPAASRDSSAGWLADQDRVVKKAESCWVNVNWSAKNKRFRITTLKAGPDPPWRGVTARDLIAEAFDGRLVGGLDDPLLAFLDDYDDVDPE